MEFDMNALVWTGVIWLIISIMIWKMTVSSEVNITKMKIMATIIVGPLIYFLVYRKSQQ